MFLPIIFAICVSDDQGWPSPQIDPNEAYASAVFALKAVGAKYELGPNVIRLERKSFSNMDPKTGKILRPERKVIRYKIQFDNRALGRRMDAEVDAFSGDVISIWTTIRHGDKSPEKSKLVTERYLKAIGRSNEFAYQPANNHFVLLQNDRPILLDLNKCIAVARTTSGQFHSIQMCGQPPRIADCDMKVTKFGAEAICAQEESKTKWPTPRFYKADLGYVYDFEYDVMRPLWEVTVEHEFANVRHVMKQVYVEPDSGKVRQSSSFDQTDMRYRPRAARIGLNPIPKKMLILPQYELAKKKLREFGQSNWTITELTFNDGVRVVGKTFDERDARIELASNGRLLELVGDGPHPTLPDAEALKLGTKVIRANAGTLPEGRFEVIKSQCGNFKEVDFIQTAHGYDCLPGPVVSAHFAGTSTLARYHYFKVMPRPAFPRGTVLSKSRIEQLANAMAEPSLPKSTREVKYSVRADVKRIGWFVPRGTSQPMLCYEVGIMQMRSTQWGAKGGGTYYLFDAITGTCYDPYPH